jgi:hypothetical protein
MKKLFRVLIILAICLFSILELFFLYQIYKDYLNLNTTINKIKKSSELEIEKINKKKNTLMLICLEKGKIKPDQKLLDSLESSYYIY